MLSRELQLGKAAEHLVCADLILQGYNAFLTDQGLAYDVCVDIEGRILRVQVKGSQAAKDYLRAEGQGNSEHIYRYHLRRARGGTRLVESGQVDIFAFAALDLRVVAYLPTQVLDRADGQVKGLIEFKTRSHDYAGRLYSNGTRRQPYGRFLEDYTSFIHALDPNWDGPALLLRRRHDRGSTK